MIPASDKWKELHNRLLLPEAFVRITYLATDPDVQPDLTSTSSDEEYYSDTNSLVNELDKNCLYYSTLEDGCLMLDGSENYISELNAQSTTDYGATGYVSDSVCGDDCLFENNPTIEVMMSKVHVNLIQGLTLTWSKTYNEFPVKYNITVWNDSEVVASEEVTDNKDIKNVILLDFVDFNKITIEIKEWCLPNKRARMEEILVGVEYTFEKDSIMAFTHTSTCDILSGKLPKNEIEFKLDNTKLNWDFNNLEGLNKYLLLRQELNVWYGYELIDNDPSSVEWIKNGTYYMNEWKMPNGVSVTFKARDLLEFMNEEYKGITSGTLYNICIAALEQANLPRNGDGSVKWFVSETLKNYETYFTSSSTSTTKNQTIAQVLQLCSNAGMCVMYQDYKGTIRIEPQYLRLENYSISNFLQYDYPEVTANKILKDVSVNKGLGYCEVNESGETQTVSNKLVLNESHAKELAEWVAKSLKYRYTFKGSYRTDPRVEVTDLVDVQARFNKHYAVAITKIKETYNGAFKGEYEGRMYDFKPIEASYSGILYSGELW